MPHDHAHSHEHAADLGGRRLWIAVAINGALTVAQVVGGVLSGSLALIADALHNLSDAASLAIAAVARRIARRPADARMTFGYARAETVAALVNFTTLILLGVYLGAEAVGRLLDPQPIEGWTVVIVAGLALAVDLATAALTLAHARESMNIRAAFLRNLADALSSVAVIAGGALVLLYESRMIDPALTLLIAGYVIWHGAREIGGAIRILMLAAPEGVDAAAVTRDIAGEAGVRDVHHLHLRALDERRVSLEAHVVSESADPPAFRARLRAMLAERRGVGRVTLQFETADEACDSPDSALRADGA